MSLTTIEWTNATWNPLTGCTKVSPGCTHCYAERLANRLKAMNNPSYKTGFQLNFHEHLLEQPLRWKKPLRIFVNSMSDLFHKDVPFDFIARVFDVMVCASRHQFQILTKRAERLEELSPKLPWPENVWQGVSVENADYTYRIDHLRRIPARTKFLSIEPLLGPIPHLDLTGIDWAIVGGESGPGARPMAAEWVREILAQCKGAGVPMFFKQWGGTNKKKTGRQLDGRTDDDLPLPLSNRRVSLTVVSSME